MTRLPKLIREIALAAIRAELAVELGELPPGAEPLGGPRTPPWRHFFAARPAVAPSILQPAE